MGASIDNKSTPTQESLPTFVICFPQDSSDLQYATAETYAFCAIKLARTRETSLRDLQQGKVQSSLFSYRFYLDTETWHAANVYIIASREWITKRSLVCAFVVCMLHSEFSRDKAKFREHESLNTYKCDKWPCQT